MRFGGETARRRCGSRLRASARACEEARINPDVITYAGADPVPYVVSLNLRYGRYSAPEVRAAGDRREGRGDPYTFVRAEDSICCLCCMRT